jgi:hypothetical protein
MEIIAELEPTASGAYCGSLGYIGVGGQMDRSVLIRTITSTRGWWQLPVGGNCREIEASKRLLRNLAQGCGVNTRIRAVIASISQQ